MELLKQHKEQNKSHEELSSRVRTIFQVDEGHRSKQTAYKYRIDFKRFLDYIKIHDLDVLLDLGKEAIQELVIKYTMLLRDDPKKKKHSKNTTKSLLDDTQERYARSTVNSRVSAIFYFFDNNEIELNKRKIRRYFPSDESVNDDRPYTRDEIAKIVAVCSSLRDKAMILLMSSTGSRIGSLHSMRIGDLDEVEFQGSVLYKVQVYARTRERYCTFTTPECYNAIADYLKYRKRYGEQLKDESPLFRKEFNKADPFTINVPKFLSHGGITRGFDEILRRSGVKTTECMRSHAFRKGFKTICEQSGMMPINVEMLLGHDTGVSGRYYRPAEADLLADYMSHAADLLTIDQSHRLKARVQELESEQADKITKLEERVKFLDSHLDRWSRVARHLMKEKELQ